MHKYPAGEVIDRKVQLVAIDTGATRLTSREGNTRVVHKQVDSRIQFGDAVGEFANGSQRCEICGNETRASLALLRDFIDERSTTLCIASVDDDVRPTGGKLACNFAPQSIRRTSHECSLAAEWHRTIRLLCAGWKRTQRKSGRDREQHKISHANGCGE